jgi:hypothetical protein
MNIVAASASAAAGAAGPTACLQPGGGVTWRPLNMALIFELQRFASTNCEINNVQQIVYGGLLSGDVRIETADEVDKKNARQDKERKEAPKPKPTAPGMERSNKSEPVQPRPAREESAMRMRSSMWSKFAVECQKQEDLVGFCCMSSKELSPDYALIKSTDPFEPCVLQLDKLSRIDHRVDVLGTHEFRFYTRAANGATEIEIKNVKVSGAEMPDSNGEIRSRLLRLYTGPWQHYNEKLSNMRRAERERANPPLITVEDAAAAAAARNSDPRLTQSSIGLVADSHTVMTREQAEHAQYVADSVRMHNCGTGDGMNMNITGPASGSQPAVSRKRYREPHGGFTEYEVQPGRLIASNHLAESPTDVLPHRQTWVEDVYIAHSLPVSMVSQGDTTGKATLSTSGSGGADSNTSRIYTEAQAALKRKLESRISSMCMWMYTDDRVRQFVETYEGEEGPTLDEMNSLATVSVTITGTIDPGQLQSLHQEGSLRYTSYVAHMARSVGLCPSDFHTQPLIPIEDLAGIAQPDPPKPGAGASKPKKKKAKSK